MAANELSHIGVARRSGRYPWGSGDRPYQSSEDKAKRKEERQKKKEERKREKLEAELQRNTFKTLIKNVDKLSDDEMKRWAIRLENRTKIMNNIPKNKSAVDAVDKGLKKASSIGDSISKLGDSFAKIKKLVSSFMKEE